MPFFIRAGFVIGKKDEILYYLINRCEKLAFIWDRGREIVKNYYKRNSMKKTS